MGLFGLHSHPASLSPDSDFDASYDGEDRTRPSVSGRRRSLVHAVLADVLRRHGVPSDWIRGHTLAVPRPKGPPRLLIQFVVSMGDDELLPYIHDIQDAFLRELQKHDPRADDWVAGISWEFHGTRDPRWAAMPPRETWTDAAMG